MSGITEIAGILNYTFTQKDLQKGQFEQARQFVFQYRDWLLEQGVKRAYLGIADYKSPNKEEMCILGAVPYFNADTFEAYQTFLPASIRTILDALIWENHLDAEQIQGRFRIAITKVKQSKNINFSYQEAILLPQYHFFQLSSRYRKPFFLSGYFV